MDNGRNYGLTFRFEVLIATFAKDPNLGLAEIGVSLLVTQLFDNPEDIPYFSDTCSHTAGTPEYRAHDAALYKAYIEKYCFGNFILLDDTCYPLDKIVSIHIE